MRARETASLRAVVLAGGGLKMSAEGRSAADLVSLAKAAAESKKRPTLIFTHLQKCSDADLKSIAIAGEGCVIFSDE
jgi:hypothetical protein